MVTAPSWIWTDCEHCGAEFSQPYDPGRRRRFCSGACRAKAEQIRDKYGSSSGPLAAAQRHGRIVTLHALALSVRHQRICEYPGAVY
jgi:hypothetical protein